MTSRRSLVEDLRFLLLGKHHVPPHCWRNSHDKGNGNELTIAVGSHLRTPSDILHLVLTAHRMHSLILSLLYERIATDHEFADVPEALDLGTLLLAAMLKNDYLGPTVRNLEINFDVARPTLFFKFENLL